MWGIHIRIMFFFISYRKYTNGIKFSVTPRETILPGVGLALEEKCWTLYGVAGNTSSLACWDWANYGPTLNFQLLKYYCWLNVGPTTKYQWWIFSSVENDGPTHAFRLYVLKCIQDLNSILLNIEVILIMQKLYNLFMKSLRFCFTSIILV